MATERTADAWARAATGRQRRSLTVLDRAPESVVPDTGCEESPTCLDCPLPQCKYDDSAAYRTTRRQRRYEQIMAVYRGGGLSVFEVSERFDVSPRTVHRALRQARRPGRPEDAAARSTRGTKTATRTSERVHVTLDTEESRLQLLARMSDHDAGTEPASGATDALDTMVGSIAKSLLTASETGVSKLPSGLLPACRAALIVVDLAREAVLRADWERAAHHLFAAKACVDGLADYNRPA